MVTLNRIYTRAGDAGLTRLATGEQVEKAHPRVEAYGAVDETNACLGLARLHAGEDAWLDAVLARVQNRPVRPGRGPRHAGPGRQALVGAASDGRLAGRADV